MPTFPQLESSQLQWKFFNIRSSVSPNEIISNAQIRKWISLGRNGPFWANDSIIVDAKNSETSLNSSPTPFPR